LAEPTPIGLVVEQFIYEKIDSVPHLEALLLLWNSRPQPWQVSNLAKRLYVDPAAARGLLQDLARRELIEAVGDPPDSFSYTTGSVERDQLIAAVDATYRREVVRISTLIHTKPSASVQAFARAFRLTKERE
jgi:predicted ArsR family transcriptional regulator